MKTGETGLAAWQLAMMALGTVVGGSFFLGTSAAINSAGPSIVISYILAGIIIYIILYALSEMTVADPAPGSFRTFAEREYGRGVGFVIGWVYWTGLILAMSSEATAVAILMHSWFPAVSLVFIGSLVIIAVTVLNLFGAERLSKLESGLAAVKLLAIAGFVLLGLFLILGWLNAPRIGAGALLSEPWLPKGLSGLAGSMLLVMFTYAGFEIIGLAASEAKDPHKTVPRAINYTVVGLVGLYVAAILALLPLIPTDSLTSEESPMVAALKRWDLAWAGNVMNIVLVTAILSTMLAAMFGLGRMIRSLADDSHAPFWLRDKREVPYKGIIFSGASMLAALGLGSMLPEYVYLFLVSSGGFALLTSYLVILATHYKFRKRNGCPPSGTCQLPLFPFSSWIGIVSIVIVLATMPLLPGQGSGLVAGLSLIAIYSAVFFIVKRMKAQAIANAAMKSSSRINMLKAQVELSEELTNDSLTHKDETDSSDG